MKIYRHKLATQPSPYDIIAPDGTSTRARTSSLGATISYVQGIAEKHKTAARWSVTEYDEVVVTVTRTAEGHVRTKSH